MHTETNRTFILTFLLNVCFGFVLGGGFTPNCLWHHPATLFATTAAPAEGAALAVEKTEASPRKGVAAGPALVTGEVLKREEKDAGMSYTEMVMNASKKQDPGRPYGSTDRHRGKDYLGIEP